MDIITLKNGIKYLYKPMFNTHSITLGLYIKTGCLSEFPIKSGIAHLLEHIHFRKIGSYSQAELYYIFEKTGSTLRATTYRDFIKFSVKIIPDYLDIWLNLFLELINTYNWSEEELENEKAVVINQIAEKGAFISVDNEVRKVVFSGTSYADSIMGIEEDIKKITISDIIEYKRYIFSENNICFTVTGNIDQNISESIVSVMEQAYINKSQISEVNIKPINWHKKNSDICIINTEDDGFFDVNISFDITCDELNVEKIRILNSILGEGIGSRLEILVREKYAFTSDIYSYVEWYKGIALLNIRFSVVTGKIYDCLNVIINELNSMKKNISQKDIDTTLPFFVTRNAFLEDDTEEMNFEISYERFVLDRKKSIFTTEKNEQLRFIIQNFAKTVFSSENIFVVIVGNDELIIRKKVDRIIKTI